MTTEAPSLVNPHLRENSAYDERPEGPPVPLIIQKMNTDEREQLRQLVEKKAWIKATEIPPFRDQELEAIEKAKKKKGAHFAKKLEHRLYCNHHWTALRWFLFGGLVDVPVQTDPRRAYDPVTNPWIKFRARSFVWTQDEHDQAQPYKRLPDKDYLRIAAYAWVHEPLLTIPKSRQMMVTWLFSSIAVHETMFRRAKNTAWISKKFDDADANIERRIKPTMERLSQYPYKIPQFKYKKGELEVPETGSLIRAMGEEAKGLRQYTFSWIFDDEAAFQEQASATVQAALPTIKGGGRFTMVSSTNGKEVFYRVVSENGRIPVPPGP